MDDPRLDGHLAKHLAVVARAELGPYPESSEEVAETREVRRHRVKVGRSVGGGCRVAVVVGGVAIVLGVAFGMASRNYQSQEVDAVLSKAEAAEQRTKEKALEVAELTGRLDDLEGSLTDLRRSMANTGGTSVNVTQASLPKADSLLPAT